MKVENFKNLAIYIDNLLECIQVWICMVISAILLSWCSNFFLKKSLVWVPMDFLFVTKWGQSYSPDLVNFFWKNHSCEYRWIFLVTKGGQSAPRKTLNGRFEDRMVMLSFYSIILVIGCSTNWKAKEASTTENLHAYEAGHYMCKAKTSSQSTQCQQVKLLQKSRCSLKDMHAH